MTFLEIKHYFPDTETKHEIVQVPGYRHSFQAHKRPPYSPAWVLFSLHAEAAL